MEKEKVTIQELYIEAQPNFPEKGDLAEPSGDPIEIFNFYNQLRPMPWGKDKPPMMVKVDQHHQ